MIKINFSSNCYFYFGEIKAKSRFICIFAKAVLYPSQLKEISSTVFSWSKMQRFGGLYFAMNASGLILQRLSDQMRAVIAQAEAQFGGVTSMVSVDDAPVESRFFSAPKGAYCQFHLGFGSDVPEILRNREIGLRRTQAQIEEARERIIEDNLARDCFEYKKIELPKEYCHRTALCGESLAVLSRNMERPVQLLSFWSLSTFSKLWEVEILTDYRESHPGTCQLTESGLVLVDNTTIVLNGNITGVLPSSPSLDRHYTVLVGTRILGFSTLSPDSTYFFSEWDASGRLVQQHQLNQSEDYLCAYDHHYWIRFIRSEQAGLPSLMEIVDLAHRTMTTLPFLSENDVITSPCIHNDRVIFGKSRRRGEESSICVYDLLTQKLVEEIPTHGEGEPKNMVSNEHFVAWIDSPYFGGWGQLQYFNWQDKKVRTLGSIKENYVLELNKYILFVTNDSGAIWYRVMIDLRDGKKISQVQYYNPGMCTYSKGIVLATSSSELFIESFVGKRHYKQESEVRLRD